MVEKSECPALAISAAGDMPAAALFVIEVCRPSWNGRIGRLGVAEDELASPAKRYLRGLERLVAPGGDPSRVQLARESIQTL